MVWHESRFIIKCIQHYTSLELHSYFILFFLCPRFSVSFHSSISSLCHFSVPVINKVSKVFIEWTGDVVTFHDGIHQPVAILKIHLRSIIGTTAVTAHLFVSFNIFQYFTHKPKHPIFTTSLYLPLLSIRSHCQHTSSLFCNSLPRLLHVPLRGSWKQRQMEQEHVKKIITVGMTIFVWIKPACMHKQGFH